MASGLATLVKLPLALVDLTAWDAATAEAPAWTGWTLTGLLEVVAVVATDLRVAWAVMAASVMDAMLVTWRTALWAGPWTAGTDRAASVQALMVTAGHQVVLYLRPGAKVVWVAA